MKIKEKESQKETFFRTNQKIFHAEIVIDNEKVKRETANYKPIPVITNFIDENGVDQMKDMIQQNYYQVKEDVKLIVKEELERIEKDSELRKLLGKGEK